MKNKIAIASAFLAAASFSTAEIVINDFLSFEGFVDMSYSHSEISDDGGVSDVSNDSENSYAIDQVEISWLFDFDTVTAQVDLQYEGGSNDGNGNDGELVEQAFVTYHLDNGGAVTAGRYASMLGFEAFEPTGLYQYSTAYASFGNDYSILPLYAQGVKYTHEGDNTFFGISLQDSITDEDDGRLGGDGAGTFGVEIAGAYSMNNGLSFFLGGAWERNDDDNGGDNDDSYLINAYTTFETGAWIFAGEVTYGKTDGRRLGASEVSDLGLGSSDEPKGLAGLLMANLAYSDQASVTARVSYVRIEEDDNDSDDDQIEMLKFTLAHGYAFTDNLLMVTEVSYADVENEDGEDANELAAAVELLFTF